MADTSGSYSLKEVFKDDPTGYANYKAGQKAGKWSDYNSYLSQQGGGNSTIQNSIKMYQEANKPAVQSLEASIPETSQKFTQQREQLQAEQAPLEQRYKNLLASIKGNQVTAENRQTVTTANELAKRGLTNTSGLFQQELTNAVNPVTQDYTTLYANTGLEQEKSLRDLINQISNTYTGETEATRAIRNAIAQLQSGAASTGITQGIEQYNTQLKAQADAAAAERQAKLDAANLALKQLLAQSDIANTNSLISQRGQESQGLTVQDLQNLYGLPGANQSTTRDLLSSKFKTLELD